ncbi:MAG: RelA/SpoT domain-containing protein [Urechidicola sp.]|nr:RelA/SpoT domain-containing protein [Urechidicola sp.]
MKNKKVEFNDEAEILVRRALSDLEEQTKALSLWLENSLKEWELHDSMIFSFQVRVKSVKSAIKKAKSLSETEGIVFKSLQDIKDNINDIVGARIIVFSQTKMKLLHQEILNHKRFNILQARVHCRKENPSPYINDLISEMNLTMDKERFNVESNNTGYTDVHYWIEPKPYDDCYACETKEDQILFDKLELQVRTITQHAWSEMQHRMVYKSNSSKQEKERRLLQFETLLDAVDTFDTRLSGILSPQKVLTPSKLINIPENDNFILESKELIKKFEDKDIKEFERKEMGVKLFKKFDDSLQLLGEKSFSYKLQICEFALKSAMYVKADKMYEDHILNDEKNKNLIHYEWGLLRYSEVCQALGKANKTKNKINELTKLVKARDYKVDSKLLIHLSVLLWECDLFSDAKDVARIVVDRDLMNTDGERIKAIFNLMYYNAEIVVQNKKRGYISQEKIFNEMFELEDIVLKIIKKSGESLTIESYDSLAYHFYIKSEYYMEKDGLESISAIESNKLAIKNIKKCLSMWENEKNDYPFESVWASHRNEIEIQERKLS